MNINIDTQNRKKGKHSGWWRIALMAAIALLLFTFQNVPHCPIAIGGIMPNLLIALAVAVAVFFGEFTGAWFGLFVGLLLDLYVTPSVGFNAMFFLVTGCVCGLLVRHLFTRNIGTAILLCLIETVFYYVLCWLIYRVFPGGAGALHYLVRYSLPSMLYSWVLIIPWYFLTRWIRGQENNSF